MTKARVNADNASADIQGVTAGTGLTGGGTSGTVTLTNDMATAIDAKGDLVVGTGADTYDNLAVGSNGETIVADSSTSTGLRYTAGTVQANPVLNSAMQVWQRGTSIAQTAAALYTADRWQGYQGTATAITYTRQTTSDTTNLPFIQYCARVQRNSGSTSTSQAQFAQSIESVNSIPYAGKTITMSFYARKGANYSMASDNLTLGFVTGTGTDQNVLTGFTGASAAYTGFTLTGTWQRFTYTATIPTTATQIGVAFYFTPTGTAGANDYFEVTGVQIDIGSVALPFRTYAGTLQGELAACQRYYFRQSGTQYEVYAAGNASLTTRADENVILKSTMRITPTAVEYSNLSVTDGVAATAITSVTIVAEESSPNAVRIDCNVASGLTIYRPYFVYGNGSTNYLAFSAEL